MMCPHAQTTYITLEPPLLHYFFQRKGKKERKWHVHTRGGGPSARVSIIPFCCCFIITDIFIVRVVHACMHTPSDMENSENWFALFA